MRKTRNFLTDLYFLGRPYFTSAEWKSAWALLSILVGLSLAEVGLGLLITYSQSIFYTALQEKNPSAFLRGLLWFTPRGNGLPMPPFVMFAALNLGAVALSTYIQAWLQVRWQRWMTSRFVGQWMEQQAHFRMMLTAPSQSTGSDNPDQRIQEDIESVTASSINLSIGLITSIVTIFTYGGLLWSLSGEVRIWGLYVPGYLFWSALLFAATSTFLTHLVGRPLASLNFKQQRLRGNFRFSLFKARENSEAIALLAGEAEERRGIARRFDAFYANFMRILAKSTWVNFMSMSFDQASIVFPTIIAAPRFFTGAITFGTLNQIRLGFLTLSEALLWFVSSYSSLASYVAQIERLATFQRALDSALALKSGITLRPSESIRMDAYDLSLATPNGRTLLHSAHFTLEPGIATAIIGSSGSGKSTLFRALSGIWPFGAGTISVPTQRSLFLPQKPYLPEGNLRRLLCYPLERIETARLLEVLTKIGLGSLADELDTDVLWSQRLSPGEQQRASLARALLLAPSWLFLDEATSALDTTAARELYILLRTELPATTFVSITHSKDLARMHDRILRLEPDGLTDADII